MECQEFNLSALLEKLKLCGQETDDSCLKFSVVTFAQLEKDAETNDLDNTVLTALKLNGDAEIPLYYHQYRALLALADLKDVIVMSPCGSGKSRIIENGPQIAKLALAKKHNVHISDYPLGVVNLPLNSIMEERLRKLSNTCCVSMTGEIKFSDGQTFSHVPDDIMEKVTLIHGHYESFVTNQGKDILKKNKHRITAHFVDEAHVTFDWGQEFRPLIKYIPGANRVFSAPNSPMVALSATLKPKDIDELKGSYGMSSRPHEVIRISPVLDHVFVGLLTRPSNQTDFDSETGLGPLLDRICLDKFKTNPLLSPTVLIFCQSEIKISDVYDYIEETLGDQFPDNLTRPWVMYHSALGAKTLHVIHQRLQYPGDHPITLIIATEKLLMGVDIPNVDIVLFIQPPKTVSKFVQGMGRCARSGKLPFGSRKGVTLLLYNKEDLRSTVPGLKDEMRQFCQSSSCLKEFLSCHFEFEKKSSKGDWCCTQNHS